MSYNTCTVAFADSSCVTRSFAKASKEEVDKIAARFQADPQKIKFLSILDEQVRLLAEEGRPDLSRFLNSLESLSIAPSREISSLRAEYGFEKEPVPQSCLDTALDRVIERVSHVLGKHPLGENDSVIVNGVIKLLGGVFDRLRSREWLNCWDIAAALEMTDRPVLVHFGVSILLHRKDQTKMIYYYNSMRTKSTLVRRVIEAEFKDLGFKYIKASCGLMVIRNVKQRINALLVGA
ncbi:hypothetical protein BKA65DRAFT_486024 [Rhexocercosporidium sp. MPI-PUGE-AT-0058]|nr:hypothetical protein BKA65DRAFT_486024 [Rhexocercosporidium sp. MPI-PUGE-AT-0058]